MTNYNNRKQMNAFARVDGARLSVILIISFACLIGSIRYAPLLGTLSMLLLIYAPFFVGQRVAIYRNNILDGEITFGRAYGYSFFTFMYGSLLLVLMQWIYFQFIDNGALVNEYVRIFSEPEYKEILNKSGFSVNERKQFIEVMRSLRPIDIALQFFMTNLFVGAVFSIFIALITKRNRNKN